MRIAGVYSLNKGTETVSKLYPDLLTEVNEAIKIVDSAMCKTKVVAYLRCTAGSASHSDNVHT